MSSSDWVAIVGLASGFLLGFGGLWTGWRQASKQLDVQLRLSLDERRSQAYVRAFAPMFRLERRMFRVIDPSGGDLEDFVSALDEPELVEAFALIELYGSPATVQAGRNLYVASFKVYDRVRTAGRPEWSRESLETLMGPFLSHLNTVVNAMRLDLGIELTATSSPVTG